MQWKECLHDTEKIILQLFSHHRQEQLTSCLLHSNLLTQVLKIKLYQK